MQMKQRQRWLMRFMMLGVMAVALGMASLVQAQTTANGPYYATPSWDQTLPAATRFIVLSNFNNQAVLDRNTGLVWEQSPDTTIREWSGAREGCLARTIANQQGWRLPSIVELLSLVDITRADKLPSGHPFNIIGSLSIYWSSTGVADTPTQAWGANFSFSGGPRAMDKPLSLAVWCVRGGMNVSQY